MLILKKLLHIANWVWRILITGIFFLMFGFGAVLLAYIFIPIIGKNKAQAVVSLAFRFFIFMGHLLGLFTIKFKNFERLQQDQGCLIVSNHPTLIDYVLIVSRLKRCNTIVKEELWNNFFLKRIIQVSNYIPNKMFSDIIPLIKKSLEEKNNILIFPEGTRTGLEQPMKLRRGAAQIAVRLKVPIIIIKITCEPLTLTKNRSWYDVPNKKPLFTLEARELVDPKDFLGNNDESFSQAANRLTAYLQAKFMN